MISSIDFRNVSGTDEAMSFSNEIQCFIGGKYAGYIEASEDCIELVEIEEEFRGMGIYKQLLQHMLLQTELQSLRSNCRNTYSNPAWEKWLGQDLDFSTTCYASLDSDGELVFIIEE